MRELTPHNDHAIQNLVGWALDNLHGIVSDREAFMKKNSE